MTGQGCDRRVRIGQGIVNVNILQMLDEHKMVCLSKYGRCEIMEHHAGDDIPSGDELLQAGAPQLLVLHEVLLPRQNLCRSPVPGASLSGPYLTMARGPLRGRATLNGTFQL